MNRKLLAIAIGAGLLATGSALAQTAPAGQQDQSTSAQSAPSTASQKQKKETLQAITVTGSLIPTAQIETANPVITITSQAIKQEGFTNIYQALRAQPLATGQVQGNQGNTFASFTGQARTISLLGLPPDFTLFMIDGHPMSDYPLLYNGQQSFTNISDIPLGMIDRIEILPGNQSSIYGSAAIAGVVNIILKQQQQGVDFNYQTGGNTGGGGYTQRLDLTGGWSHKKFDLVYGLQYTNQQPIWAFQRPYTASSFRNPNPDLKGVPFLQTGVFDFNQGGYLDPNSIAANGCGPLAGSFGNTTVRYAVMNPGSAPDSFVPTGGFACGSPYAFGNATLLNKEKTASGYLKASYQLNDNTKLYGTLLYTVDSQMSSVSPNFIWWEPNVNAFYSGGSPGIIVNANTGTFQNPIYTFSPEETGNIAEGATHGINRVYDFWGGLEGSVGQSNWNYNAFLARSQNNEIQNSPWRMTAPIDAFFQKQFLGPQLGSYYGFPVYKPNYSNFFQKITPAEFNSFIGIDHSSSETYTQNANLQVTNDSLFSLPAGEVGFAGVLQYGDQSWTLPANPLVEAHQFWGLTASSGGGRRVNSAAAVEFRVPIFKMLSVDLSAREDHFHNDGGSTNNRPTYKAAFSLRPMDTLLLRANYSTAFRMPDMGYVFVGPSGFFTTVTDYYQCERQHPGTPFSSCSAFNSASINPEIAGTQTGNDTLNPITAKSWGGGVVWSPRNFTFKADYYDIRISNEVAYQSINSLLLDDAECLLGQIEQSSPQCQTAFAAITRAGANAPTPFLLTGVTVHPINIARERVAGIVSSAAYKYDAGRFGTFDAQLQYNITLKHFLQPAPGEPTYDLMHNPYEDALLSQGGSAVGPEFKSIVQGTVSWNIGKWTSALTAIRYGRIPNLAAYGNPTVWQSYGATLLPPWFMYNATVQYQLARNINVTATVNNLFNKMPPVDDSQTGWPYYDVGAYNVYGRQYLVSMDVHF